MHVYKNWNTYGPRVMRIWDRAKKGFRDLADDVRDRGRRIVQAGRETWDRYGPVVRRGLASAWQDVQAGWGKFRTLFDGIREGLGGSVDMSWLTIDGAKLAGWELLDGAIGRVKAGWEALKAFGNGFAPYLKDIGNSMGSTINSLMRIGRAFGRIATSVGNLINLDVGTVSGFFETLGGLAGGALGLAVKLISELAGFLATVAEKIADIASGKIDWSALLPTSVVDAWNAVAGAINSVANALSRLKGGMTIQPGEMLPNGGTAGSSEDGSDRLNNQLDYEKGLPKLPFKKAAANMNDPTTRFAQAVPRQQVDVGGLVRIAVEGPGKVVGTQSDNKQVSIAAANTGRAVGRV